MSRTVTLPTWRQVFRFFVVTGIIGLFALGGAWYTDRAAANRPVFGNPPLPWIVMHGGDSAADGYNDWKLRMFIFVQTTYGTYPNYTQAVLDSLGLNYVMPDSTIIGRGASK